jgi:GH43 family beta-xylosidase
MIKHGDTYYMTYSVGGTHVEINQADNIAGPWPNPGKLVYQPPSNLRDLWAPELHRINGTSAPFLCEIQHVLIPEQARGMYTCLWTMATMRTIECMSLKELTTLIPLSHSK